MKYIWMAYNWINTEGAVVALIIQWKSNYHRFLFTGDQGCWLESQTMTHASQLHGEVMRLYTVFSLYFSFWACHDGAGDTGGSSFIIPMW